MSENHNGPIIHGYWFVAYLDLLGIRRALLKSDFLPGDDPQKKEELTAALKASVGTILAARSWLEKEFEGIATADPDGSIFADLPPEQRALAMRLRRTRVRRDQISDGIVVACPLMPGDAHFPIRAVALGIGACVGLMLVQLVAKAPIRGGLDVATGIEIDGELFGAACVRAYELESKRAQYPRLVVGDGLLTYLRDRAEAPGATIESQFVRKIAEGTLALLKQDFDGEWIVDYAGPRAREVYLKRAVVLHLFDQARAFAHEAREGFRLGTDKLSRSLFERYSHLVRYLDASGA